MGGWDCFGLVRYILQKEFGLVDIPSYSLAYSDASDHDSAYGAFDYHKREWMPIDRGSEKCGDVVVLSIHSHPIHCGLVVEPDIMLHCLAGHETALEHYLGLKWKNRIEGFYRWK
jgi:cell wall-associated NlpC family hydrolase